MGEANRGAPPLRGGLGAPRTIRIPTQLDAKGALRIIPLPVLTGGSRTCDPDRSGVVERSKNVVAL